MRLILLALALIALAGTCYADHCRGGSCGLRPGRAVVKAVKARPRLLGKLFHR